MKKNFFRILFILALVFTVFAFTGCQYNYYFAMEASMPPRTTFGEDWHIAIGSILLICGVVDFVVKIMKKLFGGEFDLPVIAIIAAWWMFMA